MPGPLLPFAFDQSRASESLPPLNTSQSPSLRRKKRSFNEDKENDEYNNDLMATSQQPIATDVCLIDDQDSNDVREPISDTIDSVAAQSNNDIGDNDDNNDSNNICNDSNGFPQKSKRVYSHLNSSSSAVMDMNTQFTNTSSTIPLNAIQTNTTEKTHTNNNSNDQNINSDYDVDPAYYLSLDIPSSPIFQSQNDLVKDTMRSDAFDDIVSFNNNLNLKPSIPSSPTLLPLSQQTLEKQIFINDTLLNDSITSNHNSNIKQFNRPRLNKPVHPLSRHGSTFVESSRKKRKNDPPPIIPTDEFAIDRDGHVFGYNLTTDQLPSNYTPTLYDEPMYFVLKNSSSQQQKLTEKINEVFDQSDQDCIKKNICLLNLQHFDLNNLPDSITDIGDITYFQSTGITKPFIHITASFNNLRSINPKIFEMEKLKMISLRNNKISRLSGNIEKAQNLESLNLGMNKLKFLPHNILNLNSLKVLAVSGNPMIQINQVDTYFKVDPNLLKLYTDTTNNKFLDSDKEIKYFSRIHWLDSSSKLSKREIHVSNLSRSLSTLQNLYTENSWNNTNNTDTTLRREQQEYIKSKLPMCPKLSELALRKISNYLISKSELSKWKKSTTEFIYKRAVNSLIYGTNGETCGNCDNNCIESVADILEWWDFKGSLCVTIKRRFCSKLCALRWKRELEKFKGTAGKN